MKNEIVPYTYEEFIELNKKFHEHCLEITCTRNAGYSPGANPYSNFMQQREILEPIFGARYPLVSMDARSGDKKSRAQNFIVEGLPRHKDRLDDFFDGANYLLMQATYWECLRRNNPKLIYGRINQGQRA